MAPVDLRCPKVDIAVGMVLRLVNKKLHFFSLLQ